MPSEKDGFEKWTEQFYSAKDALSPRDPRVYAVRPMIVIPSLTTLFGAPGALKTNIAIDLSVSIATGQKRWLAGLAGSKVEGFEIAQKSVLWVDADSGSDALHERFGAILRAHGGSAKTPIHYASFLTPPFTALNGKSVDGIVKYVNDFDAGVVVFDNLGTIAGGVDINTGQMIPVMYNLRHIAERTLAAVIVITHDPKHSDPTRRRSSIGHTSVGGAVDREILVERDADVVTVISTKTRGTPVDPFSALWTWEHKPGTEELETARFWGLETEVDAITQRARTAILTRLDGKSANQGELIEACSKAKVGRNKAMTEIGWLVRHKKIKANENQARNQTVYTGV